MAKRFTDSNKWDDPWFMDLDIEYKLAWDYIISKCDSVGVWKPSKKLIQFHLGDIDLERFLSTCGNERIMVMENGNWWIVKFCDFQYGELIEENCYGVKADGTQYVKNKPHLSYINLLKKHSLWIVYTKGIHTLKEKDKEKEKDVLPEKPKKFNEYGSGKLFVTIPAKYAHERPSRIYDLKQFFAAHEQLLNLEESGMIRFEDFIKNNPGRQFNDSDHLYSSFKKFCLEGVPIRYVPEVKNKASPFEDAELNRTLWTDEAWRKQYAPQIQNNPEFKKHFNL
jgi:hypothetical protein